MVPSKLIILLVMLLLSPATVMPERIPVALPEAFPPVHPEVPLVAEPDAKG